jgi:hypothetical protein
MTCESGGAYVSNWFKWTYCIDHVTHVTITSSNTNLLVYDGLYTYGHHMIMFIV